MIYAASHILGPRFNGLILIRATLLPADFSPFFQTFFEDLENILTEFPGPSQEATRISSVNHSVSALEIFQAHYVKLKNSLDHSELRHAIRLSIFLYVRTENAMFYRSENALPIFGVHHSGDVDQLLHKATDDWVLLDGERRYRELLVPLMGAAPTICTVPSDRSIRFFRQSDLIQRPAPLRPTYVVPLSHFRTRWSGLTAGTHL